MSSIVLHDGKGNAGMRDSNGNYQIRYINDSGLPTEVGMLKDTTGQGNYQLVFSNISIGQASAQDIYNLINQNPSVSSRMDYSQGIQWGDKLVDTSWRTSVIDSTTGKLTPAVDSYTAKQEQLYNDITTGYDKLGANAESILKANQQMGRSDLQRSYQNAVGQGTQQLVKSGLSGTTIRPTMQAGYNRQLNEGYENLNSNIAQQRLGYQTQIASDKFKYLTLWSNPNSVYSTLLNAGNNN